ncbi:MAG: ABC transporter ATP-binding protein [Ruminiclostridium sp.]|nr:ABC transporter ATP-binding protein [Ruminiclostridium sp.]
MSNIVEMRGINKTFPNNIRALKNANLMLKQGEIHSFVGENAAGKTTLMNVLYGIVHPDSGEIYIKGKKENITHPEDAIKSGIGMVHQHFKLVPEFTVLENIILGKEQNYIKSGWRVDYTKAEAAVQDICKRIRVDLTLNEKTEMLSIGIQQKIEIVKALFKGAEILILDEPTTVLAPNEISNFLSFLKDLREQGCTIIYISHRLKEIFDISNRITVMRHGETIKTLKTDETTMEEISSLMIGKEFKKTMPPLPKSLKSSECEVLKVIDLTVKDESTRLEKVSLSIRKGEILGIAGVEGNGQVELADAIIGLQENIEGEIYFNEQLINHQNTYQRRKLGIHYVPDDRMKKGLALDTSMNENAIMGYHRESFLRKRKFFIDWESSKKFTKDIFENYRVEGMNTPEDYVQNLSGGNMQKLIIGREMITNPPFLILAQPTVGLDFGAQAYIHQKIRELSEKGISFLVISEDLDELMNLSERILVLYRGKIAGEFLAENGYDEKEIGYYMTGVRGNEE